MDSWISVKEKLPETHTDVLITTVYGDGKPCVYLGTVRIVENLRYWRYEFGEEVILIVNEVSIVHGRPLRITAWMSAPEPYMSKSIDVKM